MSALYNLKTFSQRLRGGVHSISKDIVIQPFNYAQQNNYLKILETEFVTSFWQNGVRGGLVALQYFISYEGH